MDFLNPSTYWVGNRCYRVLTHTVENAPGNYVEEDDYDEEHIYGDEPNCGMDGEYNIEQIGGGRFRTSWHVPSAYYAYLIGSRGATKKRLEQDFGCTIIIPQRGDNSDVGVVGSTVGRVRTGRLQVELLVEQARRKHPPTHFLSLPLCQENVKNNLLRFKAMVMGKCSSSRGVCEKLFQEPEKLHVTMGVMPLMDDEERNTAVEAFTQAMNDRGSVCAAGGLRLQVHGLHYFKDDPGEVAVLYADVRAADEDGQAACQLQSLAEHLTNSMIKSGLMKKESKQLNLHVTVMNTSFLQRGEGDDADYTSERQGYKPFVKETFDARAILDEYKDFDFGELFVDEVHLSVMDSNNPNTGYYCSSTVLKL